MGDGGSGGDPQGHAQDPRSRLGKLLRIDVGVSPVKVEHLRQGPAQPVALLVRPRDRRAVDRRRRAERLGGDRLPAARAAGRRELRLERLRGHARLRRGGRRRPDEVVADLAGLAVQPRRRVLGHRRLRVPGRGDPVAARLLRVRRLLRARVGQARTRRRTASRCRGADGRLTQISSFGQDARGELYVVSLAGSVYRIVAR